jgi:hypothetical protein
VNISIRQCNRYQMQDRGRKLGGNSAWCCMILSTGSAQISTERNKKWYIRGKSPVRVLLKKFLFFCFQFFGTQVCRHADTAVLQRDAFFKRSLCFSRTACPVNISIAVMIDLRKSFAFCTFLCLSLWYCHSTRIGQAKRRCFLFRARPSLMDSFCSKIQKKREKNDKIRTGVSGVSGGSLCNRLACPLLAWRGLHILFHSLNRLSLSFLWDRSFSGHQNSFFPLYYSCSIRSAF